MTRIEKEWDERDIAVKSSSTKLISSKPQTQLSTARSPHWVIVNLKRMNYSNVKD